MPKVSIGLPLYNVESTIAFALERIMGQTYKNVEIVISDNASTDSTMEIVSRYTSDHPNIVVNRFPQNRGSIINYNRTVEMATGKYFMWAAADDGWEPEYIESCVEALEQNPDAALCYSATRLIDLDGKVYKEYRDDFSLTGDDPWERFITLAARVDLLNCFYGLMRTDALRNTALVRPWQEVGIADNVFMQELVLQGKFLQLDRPLFLRRRFDRNMNQQQHYARLEKMFKPGQGKWEMVFPFMLMVMATAQMIKNAEMEENQKLIALKKIFSVMLGRYGEMIKWELGFCHFLVSRGVFRVGWQESLEPLTDRRKILSDRSFVPGLLGNLENFGFLLPKNPLVYETRQMLLASMGRGIEAEANRQVAAALREGSENPWNEQPAPVKQAAGGAL